MKQQKGITASQGQLITWYQQLIQRMNDVDYVLQNKTKIEWFQINCKPLVWVAQNQLNEIQKEYCVFEDGKIKLLPQTEEEIKEGKKQSPVMILGKSIDEFDAKANECWTKVVIVAV